MKILEDHFEGLVKKVEFPRFEDHRGYFNRLFCAKDLAPFEVIQSNLSFTKKINSFRGFHFQQPPAAEDKIIHCVQGKILDFAIDVRKGSPTFLTGVGIELRGECAEAVWLPKGFAHGFITLSPDVMMVYYHSHQYDPSCELTLNYRDPKLSVSLLPSIEDISEKDKAAPFLDDTFEGVEV